MRPGRGSVPARSSLVSRRLLADPVRPTRQESQWRRSPRLVLVRHSFVDVGHFLCLHFIQ